MSSNEEKCGSVESPFGIAKLQIILARIVLRVLRDDPVTVTNVRCLAYRKLSYRARFGLSSFEVTNKGLFEKRLLLRNNSEERQLHNAIYLLRVE